MGIPLEQPEQTKTEVKGNPYYNRKGNSYRIYKKGNEN